MSNYSLETPEGKARLAARLADLGHIKQPWSPETTRKVEEGRSLNATIANLANSYADEIAAEDERTRLQAEAAEAAEQLMFDVFSPEEQDMQASQTKADPEAEQAAKPKRKRRTKAEIEADKLCKTCRGHEIVQHPTDPTDFVECPACTKPAGPGMPDRLKAEFLDFRTPQGLLDLGMAVFGDAFALDPFTDDANPVGAERYFTPLEDGLKLPWDARNVFVNPRFGSFLEPALAKFTAEVVARRLPAMLVLPSNRSESQYWQHYVWGASPVALWQSIGKVAFLAPCGTGKVATPHGAVKNTGTNLCTYCKGAADAPALWIPQTNNNYGTTCWFYNVNPQEVLDNADCHLPGSAVELGRIALGKKAREYKP